MFDAKKLLDAMVAGTSPAAAPGQGGFGDIMNQMAQRMSPQAGGQAAAPAGAGGLGDLLGQVLGGGQSGAGGGLGDMLGQMLRPAGGAAGGQAPGQAGSMNIAPDATNAAQAGGAEGGLGGMLGDLLGKAKDAAGQARDQYGGQAGDLAGMARDIFGKATSGVGDAARDIDQSTGASGQLNDLIRQMTGGQGAGDLLSRAQDLVKNNPAAAGALAGALGTLVLGTRTGRGLGMDAAKLGGMVLIGGLAYKAFKNYQAGQSASTSGGGVPQPAPAGTSFDASAQTNDHAVTYLRAMIAAAAADGMVDAGERQKIIGSLQQIGLDASAQAFLEQEFARPASVEELAQGVTSPEIGAQIYSAARVAIEPQSAAEQQFLAQLAQALNLDPALVAHIDAAASGVKS
jgi:uncharacterized membrane protein YebE (DUF533 family)